MYKGKITAYAFYRRVFNGRDDLIGALPERRKVPARITEDSILNYARFIFSWISEEEFKKDIYFLEMRI
jgi:hypothetical protein